MFSQNFVDDLTSDEFQNFRIQLGDVLSNDSFFVNEFRIDNPYPNPFKPQTSIGFNIPLSGHTNVSVYNVSGALVDVLENNYLESGYHSINWDASSQPSGVYFFKITYADQSIVKKAILIKWFLFFFCWIKALIIPIFKSNIFTYINVLENLYAI